MSIDSSLDELRNKIRAAAERTGALILPSLPSGVKQEFLVRLEENDFLHLVAHVRPKIVYLSEVVFDAIGHVASLIDSDDESLEERAEVRSFARRWKSQNGNLCQVASVIVHDGILHTILVEADWLEEIEAGVNLLEEEIQRVDVERRDSAQLEERRLVRMKAKELASDPRFIAPKASKAKRERLAEALFPDVDPRLYFAIVEEAESSLWLETVSRK